MIRQVVGRARFFQSMRLQAKLSTPTNAKTMTRNLQSNNPSDPKQHFISDKAKNVLNDKESQKKKILDGLVQSNKVVVFMKGTPKSPRCGFSNAVVQIFRMHGVNYDAHDVLDDDELREGIKEYTDWPTIPQVFINGQFVGGCDILLEMHQNGDLVETLSKAGIESDLLKIQKEMEKSNNTSHKKSKNDK